MTREEGMRIVEDMLLVCQKVKSNIDEYPAFEDWEAGWNVPAGKIKTDLYSWLYGPKDITPLLVDIVLGNKPLTDGQQVYNLMVVAHRLCPVIGWLAPLRLPEGRDLPEPDVTWCIEHWAAEVS